LTFFGDWCFTELKLQKVNGRLDSHH
jgi:hypothetical protein